MNMLGNFSYLGSSMYLDPTVKAALSSWQKDILSLRMVKAAVCGVLENAEVTLITLLWHPRSEDMTVCLPKPTDG